MYACVCKAVKDKEIKQLISEGCSLKNIINKTGAGTDCGACMEYLKDTYCSNKKEKKES